MKGVSGAIAVAAGAEHACALLATQTVRCWGTNKRGELGNGSSTWYPNATVTVKGLTTVKAIGAGWRHTCAVLTNGTARCWGDNAFGKLGDGSITARRAPVTVVGLAHATSVAGGLNHTCARIAGGTARCWGENTYRAAR